MSMTFGDAIDGQISRTENNMKAYQSSLNKCLDLFYKIAASRGKDITPDVIASFNENPEVTLRIMQWARDIREGAGERKIFRDLIQFIENRYDNKTIYNLIKNIPVIGRWDDLFSFTNIEYRNYAFEVIKDALINEKNGLCAKWMPRKGKDAYELRKYLGFEQSPKKYRKLLVELTNVVETKMCNKEWETINFSHIPSVAHSKYKKAFLRNVPEQFKNYLEKLKSGDKTVKINANAIFPHDILKDLLYNCNVGGYGDNKYNKCTLEQEILDHIIQQWNSLPNYVNDNYILPVIDVSGSMCCTIGNSSIRAIDISVSLGLYFADKNTGVFKDCYVTFSDNPEIKKSTGNIADKILQINNQDWGMSTNLHKVFDKILEIAKDNKIKEDDMPKHIIIFSDMQFNQCIHYDDSAHEMIKRKYNDSNYKVPNIIFWNLNSRDNIPVRCDEKGTILISGYNPVIFKSIMAADFDDISPVNMMLKTIMIDRYNIF